MTTAMPTRGGSDAPSREGDERSIDAVERLLRRYVTSSNRPSLTIEEAAGRARAVAASDIDELGPVALLSELLPELVGEADMVADDVRSLVDAAAKLAGAPAGVFRLQVAQSAVAGWTINTLPPEQALERTVQLAFALCPVRQLSLWELDDSGNPGCSSHAGPAPSKRTGELARLVLAGSSEDHSTGLLVGIPVLHPDRPVAALMARPAASGRARSEAILRAIAPAVGGLLDRRSLAERAATTERVLSEATERRLVRLAFDIHDGPLQNVAAVTGDLAMLRRRLSGALDEPQTRSQVLGCLDDLEARMHAIDMELRDVSHSLESPTAPHLPFARMLEAELDAFGRRTDIRAGLRIDGDFADLTDSQRIALWRIVQESLANVREHSSAREVQVHAVARPDRLEVTVSDDGRGFDVPQTLLDAARRGRLGLVGVSERARLLSGRCVVQSAPGGPTSVTVTLPRWQPQT